MISVVTGGCGFIGSHMVDRLLAEGNTVRVIDNWSTGRPQNLAHVKENPDLTIVHADIRNREEIESVFDGVDYVFILPLWRILSLPYRNHGNIILQMFLAHTMW